MAANGAAMIRKAARRALEFVREGQHRISLAVRFPSEHPLDGLWQGLSVLLN